MNLNITQKLIVGFLIVILFSIMVGTFAYVSLLQVTQELDEIISDLSPEIARERKIILKAGKLIKSAKKYKVILFIVTMLTFIVTLGVSLFLANKFTDPIISLSKKAELIGLGKLNERINLESQDEIGELAKTFNKMAASLQDRQLEIEKVNQELERRDSVLREANEKLETLNAVKSDFLSTVSHELRTPLTVIKGYVSLIKNQRLGPINTRQQKGLTAADERADHLNSLISDLLDLSRIESNKYEIRQENLDFIKLAETTINSMKPFFKKKKIHFKSVIPDNLAKIYGDKQKISQVITNLLSNAIKFTPNGGSIILEALSGSSYQVENIDRTEDYIQVNIKDSGIGLVEEEKKKIFDKFYQVDNSATREYSGTGLGLCITKNIVELHHGKIWVESCKDKGSTFSFTLPKTKHKQKKQNKQPVNKARISHTPYTKGIQIKPNNTRRKILVVEDNLEIQKLIVTCIGSETYSKNWQILTAQNGIEALETIFQNSVDLILLDINLPKLNGFDLCQIVKTNEKTKKIPVIILSASAQRSEIDYGFQMGANDYITHPFVPDEVIKRINTLLG